MSAVFTYSGVPKAGAPDCMSTFEVNPPYTAGVPGLMICSMVIPANASAFCCANAPASVIGAMAPAKVKGVMMTGWLCCANSIMPCDIGTSRRSGEFELMTVMSDGSRSRVAWSMPRAIRTISMQSMLR